MLKVVPAKVTLSGQITSGGESPIESECRFCIMYKLKKAMYVVMYLRKSSGELVD